MTKAPSPPHDDVAARTNSTYTAAHAAQAEDLCRLGATNVDLAAFFDVAEKTVRNWMRRHAAFAAAVRRGKLTADCAVTEALFQRACGFRRVDVRLFRRCGQPALRRVVRGAAISARHYGLHFLAQEPATRSVARRVAHPSH